MIDGSLTTGGDDGLRYTFYATWCGPCQMLAPTLKAVKDRLGDSTKLRALGVCYRLYANAEVIVEG